MVVNPLTFSVVIPTRNRPHTLRSCLERLQALDYPHGSWELIVVDDGGHDSFSSITDELAAALPIRRHPISRSWPAGARNAGAKLAAGEILVFLDDDCLVEPDWLSAYALGFRQGLWDALGGQSLNPSPDNLAIECWAFVIEFLYEHLRDKNGNALLLVSNNAAYRREVFEQLGGFDEAFQWAEDRDLSLRLLKSGGRQAYYEPARVWHAMVDATTWGYLRKQFNYGRGGGLLARKAVQTGISRRLMEPSIGGGSFRRALWRSLRSSKASPAMWWLVNAGQVCHRLGRAYGSLRGYPSA